MRVNGIRRLQQPQVYIGAVVAAFILYYLDQSYGFSYLYKRAENEFKTLNTSIKVNRADEKSPIDNLWVFALAVLIITFLFSAKRVYDRRSQASLANKEDRSVIKAAEGREICQKISQEEYGFQSTIVTRQEIHRLINSDAYKRTVQTKGSNLEEWNWQAKERQMGILPKTEEEAQNLNDDDFDVEQEISKVDEGSEKKQRRVTYSKSPARSNS